MGRADRVRVHAAERERGRRRSARGGGSGRGREEGGSKAEADRSRQTNRTRSRSQEAESGTARQGRATGRTRDRRASRGSARPRETTRPTGRTPRQTARTTEADRANGEAARADDETPGERRDRPGQCRKAEAIGRRTQEVVQREKAERAFMNEREATRKAIASRDQAQASALVARGDLPARTSTRSRASSSRCGAHRWRPRRARGHPARRLDARLAPARCCRAGAGRSMRSRRARAERLRPPSLSSGNGTVNALRTSADGTLVLVGAADGEARVFELATGRSRRSLGCHSARRSRARSSLPDGKSVITGDANGVIIRWDARSGARLARAVHGAPIRELAVSPDGRLVASAAERRPASGSLPTEVTVARLPHPISVDGVSFDSSGAQLLDPRARRPALRHARLGACTDRARPAGADRDGDLLSGRRSRRDRRPRRPGHDLGHPGRHPRHTLAHRGDVLDVAWSPNGSLLATASTDNSGRVFRTDTGTLSDVPRRALEPGRRRRVQPGRRARS